MAKLSQHYSKKEPIDVSDKTTAERVIEETDSVQATTAARFVIKVGNDKWLKSWSPEFKLCDEKSEAIVLNSDWARGHHNRVTHIKKMKAEIVQV